MGKFVVKKVSTGYMFNLKAGNGEIIATSEIYTSEQACLNGVESVRKNAPISPIEDQTLKNSVSEKCPKFELYLDKAGEFRFRLKASNGEIIAVAESYTTKANCLHGINSVKINSQNSTIEKVN